MPAAGAAVVLGEGGSYDVVEAEIAEEAKEYKLSVGAEVTTNLENIIVDSTVISSTDLPATIVGDATSQVATEVAASESTPVENTQAASTVPEGSAVLAEAPVQAAETVPAAQETVPAAQETVPAGIYTAPLVGTETPASADVASVVESGITADSVSVLNDAASQVEEPTSLVLSVGSAADTDVVVEQKEVVETTTEDEEEDITNYFTNLVIAQVNNYVNVRAENNTESEVVGKLYDKSVGDLLEEKDGWYKITSGNVTGYVSADYCVTGEEAAAMVDEVGTRIATVNTTTLKVRQDPSTDSPVLGLVPIAEELVVTEELDGWVKVSIEEGDGYVSDEYVDLRTDFVHAESKEEEEARLAAEEAARQAARKAAAAAAAAKKPSSSGSGSTTYAVSGGSEMGQEVANYALQFVGNPYVYGGSSLTNGTDCSGFVMSVYANFGVSLPHSSTSDRSQGAAVDGLANAQPGDIVCYSGHVALYIGNNQIVHASTSKTGIIVSQADYKSVLAVRRIF
ncbi:MAG: SH3 domain-containing protein [Lachnospiraceae bacterium]|nr:SH3 domain-containing protein [Lachnospiraceae bacterium]